MDTLTDVFGITDAMEVASYKSWNGLFPLPDSSE